MCPCSLYVYVWGPMVFFFSSSHCFPNWLEVHVHILLISFLQSNFEFHRVIAYLTLWSVLLFLKSRTHSLTLWPFVHNVAYKKRRWLFCFKREILRADLYYASDSAVSLVCLFVCCLLRGHCQSLQFLHLHCWIQKACVTCFQYVYTTAKKSAVVNDTHKCFKNIVFPQTKERRKRIVWTGGKKQRKYM